MSDYGDLNPSLGSISNTTSQLFTSRSVLTVPKGTLVDQQKLWPVQKQGRWTNPMLRKSYQNTSYEEGSNGIIFSSDFNALRKPSRSRTSRNSMSSETERKNNARTSYYGRGSRKDASQSLYDFRDSSDSKSKSPRGIWINSTAMVSHTPTLTIQYNYLADSSISMIEMWPTVKFKKHVSYLTRWWVRAKKWNLLSDELLELERGHMNSLMQDSSSNAREYESTLHEESKLDWADEQHQSVEDGFDDEIDDEDNEIVAEGDVKNSRWRKDGNRYGVRERTSLPRGFQACLSDFCSFKKARVIVIGDVHGCVTELCDLLRACNYRPGDLVVLLGDLVAKGPSSLKCIRLAMSIGAISVRGNHDQEVIRQAQKFRKELSETQKDGAQFNNTDRRDWRDSNSNEHFKIALQLSAREFDWMSHLPFFIRSDDLASLFVHAGFHPGLKLREQDPWMMMTMRSLLPGGKISPRCDYRHPWADQWVGPLTVYFGHDAARGLQQESAAVGLDTGCVYGGRLTAILLPDKEFISVPARDTYQDMRRSRSHRSYLSTESLNDDDIDDKYDL